MTTNQIKAKDIKLRKTLGEEELKEKTRANKAKENIERSKFLMSPITGMISGLSKIIGNHKEWYLKDETAAKNVANLSFNIPTGGNISALSGVANYTSCASVFIEYANMLPQTYLSGTPSDGINLTARSIYAYNRSHNSGSINYEPADYMMYLIAVGDLINLYAYLIKLARAMKGYKDIHNRLDTPKYVMQALGYDYGNMVQHEKDLYALINTLVKSIAPFAIPAGMPYYDRKLWLISNVFKQHNNDYSVFIHLHPYGFWKWKSRGVLDVAKLPRNGSNWTFENLKTYVLGMISAVSLNEDFATMAGDTVKAYGDRLLKVSSVAYDTVPALEPIYDEDALDQLASGNFVYVGSNPLFTVCQITNPDSSGYGTIYQGSETHPAEGVRINTQGNVFPYTFVSIQDSKAPDYIDVLRCTRFLCRLEKADAVSGGSTLTTKVTACGTEILCGLSIIGGVSNVFNVHNVNINLTPDSESLINYFQLTRFVECLPTIAVMSTNPSVPSVAALINGPRGRYALVAKEILDNINVVVFDSLLNVKQFYQFK